MNGMKSAWLALMISLVPSLAIAQIQGGVNQKGQVVPNDCAEFYSNGVIQDSGSPCGGGGGGGTPTPLTGDVTTTTGSAVTTVSKIQGTTVSGTTGTGDVVFSNNSALTGTPTINGTPLTLGVQFKTIDSSISGTATYPAADVNGMVVMVGDGTLTLPTLASVEIGETVNVRCGSMACIEATDGSDMMFYSFLSMSGPVSSVTFGGGNDLYLTKADIPGIGIIWFPWGGTVSDVTTPAFSVLGYSFSAINPYVTTTSLTGSDVGTLTICNSASPITLTLPTEGSIGVGNIVTVVNQGAGACTLSTDQIIYPDGTNNSSVVLQNGQSFIAAARQTTSAWEVTGGSIANAYGTTVPAYSIQGNNTASAAQVAPVQQLLLGPIASEPGNDEAGYISRNSAQPSNFTLQNTNNASQSVLKLALDTYPSSRSYLAIVQNNSTYSGSGGFPDLSGNPSDASIILTSGGNLNLGATMGGNTQLWGNTYTHTGNFYATGQAAVGTSTIPMGVGLVAQAPPSNLTALDVFGQNGLGTDSVCMNLAGQSTTITWSVCVDRVGTSGPILEFYNNTLGADAVWFSPTTNAATFPYLASSGVGPAQLSAAGTLTRGTVASGAPEHPTYQPGLTTTIVNTKGHFFTYSYNATLNNMGGDATILNTCGSNPVITLYNCHGSSNCSSPTPTVMASVNLSATGTYIGGTISSTAIVANDILAWATSAGSCVSANVEASAQVTSN